jgi:inositol oxygenase
LSGYANISTPISDSELGILILEHSLLTIQDTFVVGCSFSDKIIYPETFAENPDSHDQIYSTEYGIYQPHCGLDNVMLSWGHDEVGLIISQNSSERIIDTWAQYLYHVLKGQSSLPEEGLAMIRYHSFYP